MDDLIRYYLQRGWGSMNKNDFEVYIFNKLLQDQTYANKNDYEFSITLKIPQTKVKRLRYESGLVYGSKDSATYNAQFRALLIQAKPQIEKERFVKFAMEDKGLYLYIDNMLKQDGRINDRSFNSEVVIISIEDLTYLLEKTILSEEEKKTILLEFSKRTPKQKINIQQALVEIVKAFAQGVGSGIAKGWTGTLWDFSVNNLPSVIDWIIKQLS